MMAIVLAALFMLFVPSGHASVATFSVAPSSSLVYGGHADLSWAAKSSGHDRFHRVTLLCNGADGGNQFTTVDYPSGTDSGTAVFALGNQPGFPQPQTIWASGSASCIAQLVDVYPSGAQQQIGRLDFNVQ